MRQAQANSPRNIGRLACTVPQARATVETSTGKRKAPPKVTRALTPPAVPPKARAGVRRPGTTAPPASEPPGTRRPVTRTRPLTPPQRISPTPHRRGRPGQPRRHDAPGKRKSVQTPHHRKRARQPHPTQGEQQRRSPTAQRTHDSTSEPEGIGQPNAAQARGRPPGNAGPPDNHEPALHPLDAHRTRPRAWTTRSPGGGSGSAPVRRHGAGCSDRPTDSDLSRHEDQHQRWSRTTHKGETRQ